MSPLDWLRAKTQDRRRPLATGGPVRPLPLEPGPAPFIVLPPGIRLQPKPEDETALQLTLAAFTTGSGRRLAVARGEATYLCGCAPQYAQCRCGGTT